MHPILFHIGPLTIKTYGAFIALGLILGVSLAVNQAKKEQINPQIIMDLFFYSVLAGIIGSRLFYVAQNLSYFQENPLSILKIWEGGLSFQGGLIFAVPAAWFFLKKKNLAFWKTFDLVAPSMALGQAFGRIGCFFAGCCYGKPTDLPWGVTFTNSMCLAPQGICLHPTQVYSALGLFLIFLILFFFRKHTRFIGQLSCVYLLLHASFRVFVEFFRNDPRMFIFSHYSLTQGISVLTFLAALVLYFYLQTKKE